MHQSLAVKTITKFVTRTGASIASAVIITLFVAAVLVLVTTEQVNMRSSERERARFLTAIETELTAIKTEMAMIGSGRSDREFSTHKPSEETIDRDFVNHLWPYFGFSSAYLVDAEGRVLLGQEHGHLADQPSYDAIKPLVGRLVGEAVNNHERLAVQKRPYLLSPGHELELATSALKYDGQRVVAVVAMPLRRVAVTRFSPYTMPLVAVGVKEFNASYFANMATRQGLGSFDIVSKLGPGKHDSIALKDSAGNVSAHLRWTPERPGDKLFRDAVMIIGFSIIFIAALCIWIFSRLRGVTSEIARREEMIDKIAAYDDLSGLHNRRSFEIQMTDRLERLTLSKGSLALFLLDLDKFKPVNDLHGHRVGDELIRAVARRLRGLVGGADCVARLGGDEFAIIQSDITKPADAAYLGQRILDAIREPFEINDVEVLIGVSIGIAVFPDDTTDREALIRMADTALYQAKNEGRNRFCFFEREMDRSLQMNRIVADDLRNAIENDDLVLHYQPQISADGQSILGVEALVRWQHPIHGMIPPNDFISIAEQRGLIMPLSQWVLRRACLDLQRWPELQLAVNVSPIDFRNPEFVSNVSAILTETGFDPGRLELELTEGVVVEDADSAEKAMMELRGLGVSLALDDFGTGYSSLIYLRRFAFDKIKIDRSFLEYMETTGESAILVHSVVHLGRALGLRVCAEGVETAEQHRFLQAVGCHELQGYFFSRPIPADALDAFIAARAGTESTGTAILAA